ncbi:MAG: THUMP domain-containing protein [Candidatus Diapherotrites archaeon]|nr:THUMP domain-containing protein [Candidatus Diapherotrites archaeon]
MFEPNCVIVTIAPEVSLKTFFVRRFIEKKLRENIKAALKEKKVSFDSIELFGARYVISSGEPKKVLGALKKCFGIYLISLAQKVPFNNLDRLSEKGAEISKSVLEKGTFAVKGKSYSNDFSSKDIENLLGAKILSQNKRLKVSLSKPDKVCHCISGNGKAFFYFEVEKGANGFPVGSQGCVAFIPSKKNSENLRVAWLLMRSGCRVVIASPENFPGAELKKLAEWNSFENLKKVSIDECRRRCEAWRITAFFTPETDLKKIHELNKIFGAKVFAPQLFNPSKTPFD